VLNTNNMRDITGDAASGKRTMVVRLGSARSRTYHAFLILGGVICLLVFTLLTDHRLVQWLFLITLPLFGLHLRNVMASTDPHALDPELKRLALGTFFTALIFSLGLILA